MEYGCIGNPLGHSYSAEIHRLIGGYSYELMPLEERELAPFLRSGSFRGINVTIPYKQAVIPFLDAVSERAAAIGAVNTVVNRNGRLYGDNTDCIGLSALLDRAAIGIRGKKVLILGTGGTAKTARAVVSEKGAEEVILVSRTGKEGAVTYEEAASRHADAGVLINTTPCGMYPEIAPSPIGLSCFPGLESVVDVIYHPLRTTLLLEAKSRGLKTAGGLFMLVSQAVAAASLFFPDRPPADADAICGAMLRQKENLVFIGMPTCGKTTVGKEAAARFGRRFLDTDILFYGKFGITPAKYIEKYGENAFRNAETEVVSEVSRVSSSVIAVGGGTVLREENVRALKKNGKLIWLDRPLSLLRPSSDRPLSGSAGKLEALYSSRRPVYEAAADLRIDASGTVGAVLDALAGKDLI